MSFPSILLFNQNASVFLFLSMFAITIFFGKHSAMKLQSLGQWLAFFFAVGAVASVFNIPSNFAKDALDRALLVLPNYIYWSVLIIFMTTNRKLFNLEIIYHAVFWGVISTVVYYLYLQESLSILPIFNVQTPNTFAFVLICYTPIAIYYLKETKGNSWALALLVILTFILLKDGRRAGMVLVFLGGLAVLYSNNITWKRLIVMAIVAPLFITGFYSPPVKAFIYQSSDRIYEMMYETDKIMTKDRSYLTRVAMVKKGLAIFQEHPYTGIGLNNFSNYDTDFDKSFEGASYVVYKKDLNSKSAHNSYISLIAEGGILLAAPIFILLFSIIITYLFKFRVIDKVYHPVYIGIIGMSIHFYFISDIVNVFAWFLIALVSSITIKYSRR